MEQKQAKTKFSLYFYNGITYAGVVVALFVFFVECLLFGIDLFSPYGNIYIGLITYAILPPFLVVGLVLIIVGALRKRRKVLKGLIQAEPKSIYINPAIPAHRNTILAFLAVGTIFLVMTAVGSYKAFHYTESVQFCGVTCHKVMEPQYTRYTHSPHARVKCVECHIGPGAGWYVRSKLSGLRQVFATMRNTYPKPIPTPVHNLRPSKETCEHCHWPEKFYSSFELRRHYFLTEEGGPDSWFIRMLIQVGSEDKKNTGIHAHMYMNNDIFYVADDERRQVISWVKTVDDKGQAHIYTTPDSPYKDKEPPAQIVRTMDCIDCHNRPTHRFPAPFKLINEAMASEKIDAGLPEIKEKALEVLSAAYASQDEGVEAIRRDLKDFYKEKFGDAYAEQAASVEKNIEEVVSIYKNYFFPQMKARWDAFPDNIGHLISPGCFRCHDGRHTSSDGKTIARDCRSCHTIIEQGAPGAVEKSADGLDFQHPVDISDMWKETNCSECHTGGG